MFQPGMENGESGMGTAQANAAALAIRLPAVPLLIFPVSRSPFPIPVSAGGR